MFSPFTAVAGKGKAVLGFFGHHLAVAAATSAAVVLLAGGGAGYVIGTHNSSQSLSTASASPGSVSKVNHHPKTGGAKKDRAQGIVNQVIQFVAKQTGQTPDAVRAALQNGQTIDDIAGAKASDIESSLVAKLKTRLDKQVSQGKLTADQENMRLNAIKTRLDKLMATPGNQLMQAGSAL